jgi:uncharacterized membrane protein YhaH (DUF805 family)
MSQPVGNYPPQSSFGASPAYPPYPGYPPYPPQPQQVVVNVHQHMQQAQGMYGPIIVAPRISLKARWATFLATFSLIFFFFPGAFFLSLLAQHQNAAMVVLLFPLIGLAMAVGGILLGHSGLRDARASNGLMRMKEPVEALVCGYIVVVMQLVVIVATIYVMLFVS